MTRADSLLTQDEAISPNKLASTLKTLQKLTDTNDHAQALVVFTELVGDKKAIAAANAFVAIRDYERSMPSELSEYIYQFRRRMLVLARRKLGDQEADALYQAM